MNSVQETELIEGEITSMRRFDSGYAVLRVEPVREYRGGYGQSVTIVGDLAHLTEGMRIKAHVVPKNHAKYGLQYQAVDVEETIFNTLDGIVNYLASDAFKNIGNVRARMVVSHFGLETVEVLDAQPERIFEVPGLTPNLAQQLIESWAAGREQHRLLAGLMTYGLSAMMARKVQKEWGERALEFLEENPYLLTEISGIGFHKADDIALKMGTSPQSVKRVEAAMVYVMEQALTSGHCFLWRSSALEETLKLLHQQVAQDRAVEALSNLCKGDYPRLTVVGDRKVYLTKMYETEIRVADNLKRMLEYERVPFYTDMDQMRDDLAQLGVLDGITLASEQEEAIYNAINTPVAIITGGPGTGKSTITKALCALMKHHGIDYLLASPTGRAAKRLAEATGEPASTIHRMLQYDPETKGFAYNEHNKLPTNCVLIDESSMVDINLLDSVLLALDRQQRLVFVGDANQLPSVGPGNVLRDLIESGAVETVTLQHIFRQAAGSTIITAAHDVLHGDVPDLPLPKDAKGKNCLFVGAEEPETLIQHMLTLITEKLPKIGYDPDQIQALTPMRQRGLGIDDLNPRIQQALNPPSSDKAEFEVMRRIFRVGDRVMQIKNNYRRGPDGIFNGDIGIVSEVRRAGDTVTVSVKYPDIESPVEYAQEDLDELYHAFAMTVHKSQGAEYPVVLMVLHPSQHVMLQRNLFYTGLTRAKKLCIILGTRGAIETAVNNDRIQARNTTLKRYLRTPDDA